MKTTNKTSKKAPMTATTKKTAKISLHPVIEKLLERNPLNKASKFNAKHDWLEYTSWDTLRGVDHSIYTCKDADIQRRAFDVALTRFTARDGETFEVIYYNMKTGEKFRPELVIESVKLSPVPSRNVGVGRNGLSSDGMDDRPW